MSPFKEKIIKVVRSVPFGQVVSYGQVSAYIGVPRGARHVGWILRTLEGVDIPWWRVVNNSGRISIEGNLYNDKHIQKKLLEQEHIEVSKDFTFAIEQYRFIASEKQLKAWGLDEEYRAMLHQKYFKLDPESSRL